MTLYERGISPFCLETKIISTNKSKNGNYSSVSINVVMPNADTIIDKYKEVSIIEGIISL